MMNIAKLELVHSLVAFYKQKLEGMHVKILKENCKFVLVLNCFLFNVPKHLVD